MPVVSTCRYVHVDMYLHKNIYYIFIIYRSFLEHDLIDYAKHNSGVVVYVKPRRHRNPVIKAEYCKFIYYLLY